MRYGQRALCSNISSSDRVCERLKQVLGEVVLLVRLKGQAEPAVASVLAFPGRETASRLTLDPI